MVADRNVTGKAMPMIGGILSGSGIALVLTLAGALVITWMVDGEILDQTNIGYGIMLVLLASSAVGAWSAVALVKRQRLPVTMAAGGLYLLWLLGIATLCFGGNYQGIVPTALMVLGSSLAVALIGNGKKGNRISVGHNVRYG